MKKYALILLIGLQVVVRSIAGIAPDPDSLKVVLQLIESEEDRLQHLISITTSYVRKDTDSAFKYNQLSEDLALKLNDQYQLAKVYEHQVNIFNVLNQYEKVLGACEKIYKIGDSLGDNTILNLAFLSYGNYYFARKEYDKAIEWGKKALDLEDNDKNPNYPRVLYNVGLAYSYRNQLDSAEYYFKRGLKVSEETGSEFSGVNLSGLSLIQYHKGDIPSAIRYAEKALVKLEKVGNMGQYLAVLNSLGVFYFQEGDYQNAIRYFKKSLSHPQKAMTKYQEVSVYGNLAIAHGRLKEYKLAYEYSDSCAVLTDSLYKEKIIETTKEMEARFDLERKNKELALLEQQKLAKDTEISKQRQFNYGLIAFGMMSLILISVLYKNNRLRKKTNRLLLLEKQNEQNLRFELEFINQKLMKENVMAQFDTLKNQINPHFLFNSLNALGSLIAQSPEKAIVFANEFSRLYRKTLEVNDMPLVSLQDEMEICNAYLYLQHIRFGKNLKIDKNISVDAFQLYLPPFSVQMLLENAMKHNMVSKNQKLTITIYNTEKSLIVENNIQLRKDRQDSTGLGIKNIISRYELIGDRLPIIGAQGDVYRAELPLLPNN